MAVNFPLLMTQYERYGSVGRDAYIDVYIDEVLDVNLMMLGEFNEYLSNNAYETIFLFDDLDWILEGMDPIEVFRLAKFSDVSFSDDYLRFNGYGNLESMSEYQVVKEMEEDRDFLHWYVEHYEDLDEEEISDAIEKANRLIAAGY